MMSVIMEAQLDPRRGKKGWRPARGSVAQPGECAHELDASGPAGGDSAWAECRRAIPGSDAALAWPFGYWKRSTRAPPTGHRGPERFDALNLVVGIAVRNQEPLYGSEIDAVHSSASICGTSVQAARPARRSCLVMVETENEDFDCVDAGRCPARWR